MHEPGWCKLDWVISDQARGVLANASNVLDPTWEAPDGKIVPLDGFLDPYFQEVYLDADSIPLFSRLVKELGADAVDDYVEALEHEVWKYTVKEPNYGKAARRMYNVFRLTGRYTDAAYLRELFDEPVTALYQVAALLRTLDDAADAGEAFEAETMVAQTDQLIMSAIGALEGRAEAEMVAHLLRLRDSLRARAERAERDADIDKISEAAMAAVNDYFYRMLTRRSRHQGLHGRAGRQVRVEQCRCSGAQATLGRRVATPALRQLGAWGRWPRARAGHLCQSSAVEEFPAHEVQQVHR